MRFIEVLADRSEVGKLSIGYREKFLNYESRGITQGGSMYNEPYSLGGLTGAGQIAGVADSGLDDLSCYFYDSNSVYAADTTTRQILTSSSFTESSLDIETNRRKVITYFYNSNTDKVDDMGGHGTHVVGSVLGKCEDNLLMNGMASEGKVAFFDIGMSDEGYLSLAPSYYSVYEAPYLAGARIHSNSWGSNCEDLPCDLDYDYSCEVADEFMSDYPDMLLLFAAGNEGNYGQRSIGSPALAKNSLAVGAMVTWLSDTSNDYISQKTMSDFSSHGPTADNRYGIDIAAPGDYIMSASACDPSTQLSAINSGDGEMQLRSARPMSGTSMATPVTAGNLLLIRQFFEDSDFWANVCNPNDSQCEEFNPSASLVKATLLHSGSQVDRYAQPGHTTS